MNNNLHDSDIDSGATGEENAGVYLSISDLMSSLLMIFAMLFINAQIQLESKIKEADALKIQIEEYKKAVDELPVRILNALEGKMGGKGLFSVDKETGDVSIGDRILFDSGSATLKPEGKQFMTKFIPVYSGVIFSSDLFEKQITRVVIEGHTSSNGAEKDNMELSLRRALAVSNYISSNDFKFPTKERFKEKILASGRGEIESNEKVDDPRDRKVVFRFQFQREDFKQFLGSKDGKHDFSRK
jgi:outer membrane protein OmpA-like peptidoglycan-associated protein